jgi:hydroxymethylbilane synthase
MSSAPPIYIATRGSALALAQANFILAECRRHCPGQQFELNIIKTTGDKMQTASMARIDATLPRGLFTKELEDALLQNNQADLAVHSLKDLPTILPDGLKLGAAGKRADVRDVLIYRASAGDAPALTVSSLPRQALVGTSSTRRSAQIKAIRPDVELTPIRGNVGTRLRKVSEQTELSATVLAAAGLQRLGYKIDDAGNLHGEDIPKNLRATFISLEEMLPCVGQAALGIEIRESDPRLEAICARLNHAETWHCVTAERAFLRGMGGGCQSAVAAYAQAQGQNELRLRAVSFLGKEVQRGDVAGINSTAGALGESLAAKLKPGA